MKNKKIIISILVLMLIAVIPVLANRILYEENAKNVFLSANYDDILDSGLDTEETLLGYHSSGVNFVTIKPETINSLRHSGIIDIITYSSLSINSDAVSEKIKDVLYDKEITDQSSIVIAKTKMVADYLNGEFKVRYNGYIFEQISENVWIFCFNTADDIIVGYDRELISWLKSLNMQIAIEYPSYSFLNEKYSDYFSRFLKDTGISFIILCDNIFDNKQKLLPEFVKELGFSNTTLVVFENPSQISNEKPFIYDDLTKNLSKNLLRGFNTDEAVKYDNSNFNYRYYQWYNSIMERNTKFININVLKNEELSSTENFELTKKAIERLVQSLTARHYLLPVESLPRHYPQNSRIAVIAGFLVILLMTYIYLTNIFKFEHFDIIFIILGFISIFANYIYYEKLTNIYSAILVIEATSLITLFVFRIINSDIKKKIRHIITVCLCTLFLGIALISAMLSGINYYIGTNHFSQVNISVLVPIFITVLNYYIVFIGDLKQLIKKLLNTNRAFLICVIIMFVLILTYYIIRNGKSELIIPFEYHIRNYLSDLFYIRPRFKEIAVGYEAFTLFVFFAVYKKKCSAFLAIFSTILFTSILNTFCHSATAFLISVQRTLNGVLCYIVFLSLMIILLILKNSFASQIKR